MKIGLKTKISFLVFLVILVSLTIAGYVISNLLGDAMEDQVAQSAMNIAQSFAAMPRLADIDVLTDRPLSRSGFGVEPRRCFICSGEARACIRSAEHPLREVRAEFDRILEDFFTGRMPISPWLTLRRLADSLVRGARRELDLTPKPGLVDRQDSGSHPDLTYARMRASVRLLPDYYADLLARLEGAGGLASGSRCSSDIRGLPGPSLARLGPRRQPASLAPPPPPRSGRVAPWAQPRQRLRSPGSHGDRSRLARGPGGLRAPRGALSCAAHLWDETLAACIDAGRLAEARMLAKLGTNTHRGYIFLSGLALVGAHRVAGDPRWLRAAMAETARDFFDAVPTGDSHGSRACRDYAAGGIRREAEAGFPSVFERALPAYAKSLQRDGDRLRAEFSAMASLMQYVEDTTALHRCGPAGLGHVRRDGRELEALLERGRDPRPFLRWRNKEYRKRGLTMGGVADCLALTFALAACYGEGVIGINSPHPSAPL